MTEIVMSIIIPFSITGHGALAYNYYYIPLLPILYLLYSQQIPRQVLVLLLDKGPILLLLKICALCHLDWIKFL